MAGQNATAWLSAGDIALVDHSTTAGADCTAAKAFPVRKPMHNKDYITLIADGATDVFYAIGVPTSSHNATTTPETVLLAVDVG